MSKAIARSPKSYENEELLLALMPPLLEQRGFSSVVAKREGGMKFVDARTVEGSRIRFWVKQGWTGPQPFSAIQFGLFGEPGSTEFPNEYFTQYVADLVASAKAKGATHALLVHMANGTVANYVALEIDDVAKAYRNQMEQWPKRARNTKTPTLWFEDHRDVADAEAVTAVTELEMPLSVICGAVQSPKGTVDSKKITAEVELRMRQQVFRLRVGKRCNWQCVVTGSTVKAVLDAAHLPGRNWRTNNEAEDGVLIRTDLHRLLDRGLAELRDGRFWLCESLRLGEYSEFHSQQLAV